MRYALYPHVGNEKVGQVKETAYSFNIPLRQYQGNGAEHNFFSLMHAENAIVEAVKVAEDGNGLILRAYKPYGSRGRMHVALDGGYSVIPCDLMENPIGKPFASNPIDGEIKPFEICSWRLNK